MNKLYLSKNWLDQQYNRAGLSVAQIAKICGVSEMTINRQLVKFKLMRNTRTQ